MLTVACVFAVMAILGAFAANHYGTHRSAFGWPAFEPDPIGCAMSAVGILGLVCLGLMKLGAWLL